MTDAPTTEPAPAAAPKRRSRLSRGRKVQLLALMLGGVLLLGEGIARLVSDPPPPAMFVPHPYLRHVRPPSSGREMVSALDGTRYFFHVDEYGFRCQSLVPPDQPKPKDAFRIFFVGASTTENLVIPDEETFPYLVEVSLNEKLGGRLKVRGVNTGISGNTIADSFSLIAHRLLALEPDLIVVLHAINDMRATLSDSFDTTHYADRRPPRPARIDDVLLRYSRLYEKWSAFRRLLKYRSKSREARLKETMHATPLTEGLDPGRGLPYFRRYVRMIAAVCKDAGVPLVLMTQPSLYKPTLTQAEQDALWMGYIDHGRIHASPEVLREGMQRYNQELRRLSGVLGVHLIDLEAAVPKDLEHMFDDCHYTRRGNQVVAATIVEGLLKQKLLH